MNKATNTHSENVILISFYNTKVNFTFIGVVLGRDQTGPRAEYL